MRSLAIVITLWNIKSASYENGSRTLPPDFVAAIVGNNGEVKGELYASKYKCSN